MYHYRPITKDEMIAKYRKALEFYAASDNWGRYPLTNAFLKDDACKDDCSGYHLYYGETARQALLYNERATVCEKIQEPLSTYYQGE